MSSIIRKKDLFTFVLIGWITIVSYNVFAQQRILLLDNSVAKGNGDPDKITGSTNTAFRDELVTLLANNVLYVLTVSVNPVGAGVVQIDPEKNSYNPGEEVVLTVLPNGGYNFDHWSGDIDEDNINPRYITMVRDRTIVANFTDNSEETVSSPNIPNGPSGGVLDEVIDFTTGGGTSSKGDEIEHQFDWGNGNYSSWGSTSGSVKYTSLGNYEVRARVRCKIHTQIVSDWSAAASINISTGYSLNVEINPLNAGSIVINPNKNKYGDNETVQLFAIPASASTDNIHIEAESGNYEGQISTGNDAAASGEMYIYGTTNVPQDGSVEYTFNIQEAGNYVIWGRCYALSDIEDSFFFQVDGDAQIKTWHLVSNYNNWVWQKVTDFGVAQVFNFSVGSHTLKVIKREKNSRLDKLIISKDPNLQPEGKEEVNPADNAYLFSHWSGDLTGDLNPATMTMNNDKNVVANFVANTDEVVSTPTVPSGPSNGNTNDVLTFTTDGAVSSLGHTVEYQFDWGDASQSAWGTSPGTHSYTSAGSYEVLARARCATHTAAISNWSAGFTVNINAGNTFSLNIVVSPVNAGSVALNPNKNGYDNGETVQLTAIPFSTSGSEVRIEAENGSISGPISVGNSTEASGGQYIYGTTIVPQEGSVEYTFNIIEAGNYVIWGRCYALTNIEDSFFLQVDGDANLMTWHLDTNYNTWIWQKVSNASVEQGFTFTAGTHTLKVIKRDINARLDKLIITKDTNFQPQGKEEANPADTAYLFSHWSGDLTGTNNPDDLAMNANKNVTAHFTINAEETVTIPSTPVGPDSGMVGNSLQFTSGGSFCNYGHSVEYQFDWGDGEQSSWVTSPTAHTYNQVATFQVKARARCQTNIEIVSGWSNNFIVIIFGQKGVYDLNVSVNPDATGLVHIDPKKDLYDQGESVQLAAIPNSVNGEYNGDVYIEAEAGLLTGNFGVGNSTTASADFYLYGKEGVIKDGSAEYSFNIQEPGNYTIWGRCYAFSGLEDSFFLQIDEDGDLITWHLNRNYNNWVWQKVSDLSVDQVFSFNSGQHSLKVIQRDVNARLDKLIITKNPGFRPTGKEDAFLENSDFLFSHWSGDLTGTQNPATITMSSDKNVVANFLENVVDVVSAPGVPSGPGGGYINEALTFTSDSATSNLGHPVEYQFEWGDGVFSDWGPPTAEHTYPFQGSYEVRARARCTLHTNAVSAWSAGFTINITQAYNLNVDVSPVNAGSVAVVPDKDKYGGGENVQLTAIASSTPGDNLQLEAESGILTGSIAIANDAEASGGLYIHGTSTLPQEGSVVYTFNIQEVGNYVIWGRCFALSNIGDSFFFQVDGDTNLMTWHLQDNYNNWVWQKVSDLTVEQVFTFTAGQHTVKVIQREQYARLDKLIITKDINFQPAGKEEINPADNAFIFTHWEGDLTGNQNPATVAMNSNTNIVAHFIENVAEVVSVPNVPSGADTGYVDDILTFTTGGATTDLGHNVEYQFDWGDGTLSDWGSSTGNYTYTSTGTFQVRARARCVVHTPSMSAWSAGHAAHINESLSHKLTVEASSAGGGGIIVSPYKENYTNNETVQLTALAYNTLNNEIRIEAESGSLSGPVAIGNSTAASRDQYVYGTTSQIQAGSVEFTFNVKEAGNYVIWGRCYALTPVEDSFFLQIDGNAQIMTWHLVTNYNIWIWQKVADSFVDQVFSFSTGQHTLKVIKRDINARLDKLIITKNYGFKPTDEEDDPPGNPANLFSHWSGDLSGEQNPVNIVMDKTINIVANFIDNVIDVVSVPNVPSGPDSGYTSDVLTFSAGGAVSNLDHNVEYQFDWGNGSFSEWGLSTADYTYPSAGVFEVRARARCTVHTQVASGWSDGFAVHILAGYSLIVAANPSEAGGVEINPLKERYDENENVQLTIIPFGSSNNEIRLEAENGNLSGPISIGDDAEASGGQYIYGTTDVPEEGSAEYVFNIQEPGNYYIWGRCFALSGIEDSFFYQVDDEPDLKTWHLISNFNNWVWQKVSDSSVEQVFTFTAGYHKIKVIKREKNARLDKLIITNDPNFQPTGKEDTLPEDTPYLFSHWSGDLTGNQSPVTITMNSNKNIAANFIENVADVVSIPDIPNGPDVGYKNEAVTFTAGGATSNLDHSIEYQIDWGDGTQSGWGSPSGNYTYTTAGYYELRARARCTVHTQSVSDWSASFTINIISMYNLNVETTPQFAGGVIINPAREKYDEGETVQLNASPVATSGGEIIIEAESGKMNSPVLMGNDGTASGGFYIYGSTSESKVGSVEYSFKIREAGTYIIWGRCYALSGIEDSFFFQVDEDGDLMTWHLDRNYNKWLWQRVSNSSVNQFFTFTEGQHTVKVIKRDINARLDKLIITKDFGFRPNGKEDIFLGEQTYLFSHWSGAITGNQNPVFITMDSNKTVVVNFFEDVVDIISIPNVPSGPDSGYTGDTLTFTADGATSNVGHAIEYQFDWGDGNLSDWGFSTRGYSFTSGGSFEVQARARCQIHTEAMSGWSASFAINITAAHSLIVEAIPAEAGNVTIDPIKDRYSDGETVKLTAVAASGSGTDIRIEAESGTITGLISIENDPDASGGMYVYGTSNTPQDGSIEYSFNISEAGEYTIWGRCYVMSDTGDSFFLRVDGETNLMTWFLASNFNSWVWQKVSDMSVVQVFNFSAGLHTLKVIKREKNAWLDKLILTKDPNFQPTGKEDSPAEDNPFLFSHWSGDLAGSQNPVSITMNSNKNITANFIENAVDEVSTPNVPSGADSGSTNELLTFIGDGAASNLGHNIEYQFDWGDGNLSEWGASTQKYSYPLASIYEVRARARCTIHTQAMSNWSAGLSVKIVSIFSLDIEVVFPGAGGVIINPFKEKYSDGETVQLTASPVTTSGSDIRIEAESGKLNLPVTPVNDGTASGGFYVSGSTGEPQEGSAEYRFIIKEPGAYVIWGRCFALSDIEDSFFYQLDENTDLNAWYLKTNYNKWIWQKIAESGVDKVFTFTTGTHTLKIIKRENNTRLDKILITKNFNFTPQGKEDVLTGEQPYMFSQWSGDLTGSQNPVIVTMNGNKNIVANFYEDVLDIITIPNIPSGPDSGSTNDVLTFTTEGATSNVGHTIEHQFDWGNGTFSDWGSSTRNYTYTSSAIYEVRARARCTIHTQAVSGWSGSLTLNVAAAYTLNVVANPSEAGSVSINPIKDLYRAGENVQLTAVPISTVGANIRIEAESGTINGPFAIGTSTEASGNFYIYGTSNVPQDGSVEYTFDITEAGIYTIWGRCYAASDTGDSFFLQVDGAVDLMTWYLSSNYNTWIWQKVSDNLVIQVFTFSIGQHTVKVIKREKNARLDKLIITKDTNFQPSGKEDSISEDSPYLFSHWSGNLTGSQNPAIAIMNGNKNITANFIVNEVDVVSAPNVPAGPDSGNTSELLTFFADGATSNLGHNIEYQFDWGNGSYSSWGSSLSSYTYPAAGTYEVRAHARCTLHTQAVSDWSTGFTVKIIATYSLNVAVNILGAGGVRINPFDEVYSDGESVQLNASPIVTSAGNIRIEAEIGKLTPPISLGSDGAASGGFYISGSSITPQEGSVEFTFNIKEAGDYVIWGRCFALSDIEDSFFYQVDDEPNLKTWHLDRNYNEWVWQKVSDSSVDKIFTFTTGTHTIKVIKREKNAQLDKLVITKNFNFTPQGKEDYLPEDSDYLFSHWSGALAGSQNPVTMDIDSNMTVIANFSEKIIGMVSIPGIPVGQDSGYTDEVLTFKSNGSTSNLDHNIEYQFDWGDGNVSEWVDSVRAYNFKTPGAYSVLSRARSKADHDIFSNWSDTLITNISGCSLVITLEQENLGDIKIEPDQVEYAYGALVKLTAINNSNFKFVHWNKNKTDTAKVKEIKMNGDTEIRAVFEPLLSVDENSETIPKEFSLKQNYPNPFNPETTVEYLLAKDCNVQISIINIKGQLVDILVDEMKLAGSYSLIWNAMDKNQQRVPSGIYMYQIKTEFFNYVRKMLLLK